MMRMLSGLLLALEASAPTMPLLAELPHLGPFAQSQAAKHVKKTGFIMRHFGGLPAKRYQEAAAVLVAKEDSGSNDKAQCNIRTGTLLRRISENVPCLF